MGKETKPSSSDLLRQIYKNQNKHMGKILQSFFDALKAKTGFKEWIQNNFVLSKETTQSILNKLLIQLEKSIKELKSEEQEKYQDKQIGEAVFKQLFSIKQNRSENELFDAVKLVSYKSFLDSAMMYSFVRKKQTKDFYRANHQILKKTFFNKWLPSDAIQRYFKYTSRRADEEKFEGKSDTSTNMNENVENISIISTSMEEEDPSRLLDNINNVEHYIDFEDERASNLIDF